MAKNAVKITLLCSASTSFLYTRNMLLDKQTLQYNCGKYTWLEGTYFQYLVNNYFNKQEDPKSPRSLT